MEMRVAPTDFNKCIPAKSEHMCVTEKKSIPKPLGSKSNNNN